MNSPRTRRSRVVDASVCLCFFLSGAAGLVYEIVWMRLLGLVFGHTVFAVTTVLAAFMAGLALGAYLFGRMIDAGGRPLLVYALLEAATGVYALLIPFLLAHAQSAYLWVYRSFGFSLFPLTVAQFVLASLILLLPTTLMGGSLPVLSKFFVREVRGLGRRVADLYALNTLGAVAGSAAAGFVLLPAVGVRATTLIAAGVNLAIAACVVAGDRWLALPGGTRGGSFGGRRGSESGGGAAQVAHVDRRLPGILTVGIAVSGAASLVYEIAWTRALALVLGSSVYAFATMLTTFLAGLSLGGFLFARLSGRRGIGATFFGFLEYAVAVTVMAVLPLFEILPSLVLRVMRDLSPSHGAAVLTQFGASFLVMLVPTTLIGATLPCVVQICSTSLGRLGRDVGRLYGANTMGTICGSVLGGFLLLPWMGPQASIGVAAVANATVSAATVVAVWGARRGAAIGAVLLAVAVAGTLLVPRWDPRVMAAGPSVYAQRFASARDPVGRFRREIARRKVLFYRDGLNSTVSVQRTARMTFLTVNGKVDASNGADMLTQLMLGHLPIFLHPRPERVLVVGLGSGITAGAVAQHPVVREIDVVELEPAVVEASRFFAEENRGVLADPRVRVVIGDGRNFVLASGRRYDVISSEPSNPWMAGVASLFSREFYELCRRHLRRDGIMVQWVHGYSLFPHELKMIVNTFTRVFPHATLWRTLRGDYLLVGAGAALTVDYALLEGRVAASAGVRQDMAILHWDSPLDLLTLFLLDDGALRGFAEDASENTDDRPLLEFAAPLALYAETTDENARLLQEARRAELPPIVNVPPGLVEARRLRFARTYWARGEREEALRQLRRARRPEPEDVSTRLERAKLLFALGDLRDATDELTGLLQIRPRDRLIASYLKAGAVLRELEAEGEMARRGRTRAGDPNPAEAFNNLGVFYTQAGIRYGEPAFFDLAVDALEAALRIEPSSYPVLNNLANAYFELGRLDEAARAYRKVIHLEPGLAEARFNLGLVYERKGMREEAARELEAASALRPDWPLPRMHLRRLGARPAPAAQGRRPLADTLRAH